MEKYDTKGSDDVRICIADALFTLLLNSSFDDINVGDICSSAAVGRTTFYRYFGSKNGKRDALLFWMTYHWDNSYDNTNLSVQEKDTQFMNFLYTNKDKLILIKNNNHMEIIDDFILYVYGPADEDPEYYLKYTATGLWFGFVRAIMKNNFKDDAHTIQAKMAESLMKVMCSK